MIMGDYVGSIIGVTKGDTRSLDYGSCAGNLLFEQLCSPRKPCECARIEAAGTACWTIPTHTHPKTLAVLIRYARVSGTYAPPNHRSITKSINHESVHAEDDKFAWLPCLFCTRAFYGGENCCPGP